MRTDPQPGLPAKFAATCPRCPVIIQPGDRIVFQLGVYIHVACASGADGE